MEITIEQAERIALDQVKFINSLLEQLRARNESFKDALGMTYAKLVGLGTPYEEAIHSMRKVKTELDEYLARIRAKMVEENMSQTRSKKVKKRQFGHQEPN